MLLVHAILPAEIDSACIQPRPADGLRGWPLRRVYTAELVGWATDCPEQPSLGRADLLAHHALAEQALACGACLPVRFPTWLPDEGALRELLRQRQSQLRLALDRVRGKVELAVTALYTGPASAAAAPLYTTAGPGRHFLEERRRNYRRADQLREVAQQCAAAVEQRLGPDLVDARHAICPSQTVALSSALLVPADRAADLRDALRSMRPATNHVRILVNGPWPPYSFSELTG